MRIYSNMRLLCKTLLAVALIMPVYAAAQDDASLYMEQSAGSALLYRGHIAQSYPMAFNGTWFWTGPAFEKGEVAYNGTVYRDIPMNVDASRQELLVKTASGAADKVLNRDYVTWFTMGGHRFLNLQQTYGSEAPAGYWEVLYDGRARIVRQVVRSLRRDMNGELRPEIGYDDSTYRPEVHQTFTRSISYCYISEDGQIVPVRRRAQVLEFYKDRKREINRHISNRERAGKMDFESFCTEAVRFAETL